jgi:hypothetical protein
VSVLKFQPAAGDMSVQRLPTAGTLVPAIVLTLSNDARFYTPAEWSWEISAPFLQGLLLTHQQPLFASIQHGVIFSGCLATLTLYSTGSYGSNESGRTQP